MLLTAVQSGQLLVRHTLHQGVQTVSWSVKRVRSVKPAALSIAQAEELSQQRDHRGALVQHVRSSGP